MSEVLQIPATLTKFESMSDNTFKLIFHTQESPAERLSEIMKHHNHIGWLSFAVRQIEAMDISNLPKIDTSDDPHGKTRAQRLRSVIYVLWKQKGCNGNPEDFYARTMEGIIEQIKDKLE